MRNTLKIRHRLTAAAGFSLALLAAVLGPSRAEDPGFTDLITDPGRVFTIPSVLKPLYLVPFMDPVFGTRVSRISNDPGTPLVTSRDVGTWGEDARHHYSKDQPWNSDGTLIALQNSNSPTRPILDAETYLPKYSECRGLNSGEERWHPSIDHPNERINASGSELRWIDVARCEKTRSWPLPFSVQGIGPSEGNVSNDGRFVALTDSRRMFVVDMDPQSPFAPYPNRRIGPPVDISNCGLPGGCQLDWVSVSASGKYVVVDYMGQHPRVYNIDFSTLALTPRPMPEAAPRCNGGAAAEGYIYDLGHADLAVNPFDNNEDVLIGQEHCSNRGQRVDGKLIGGVVMVRLRDGAITSLTDPTNEAYPHHISTRNYDRPGWVYVGYYPESGKRFADEIVAVKLDGSKSTERYAHKHSSYSGCYRCESHSVPSRDGRRILWASNWAQNCQSCGAESDIKAYVVDARATSVSADSTGPSAPAGLRVR